MAFDGRNVVPFHYAASVCIVMWMSSLVTGALGIRNLNFTTSKVDASELIIPALVVFGDSTVDAGNNNYLHTIIKSDFVPYGRSFEGHVPTGRFTDGLLTTDFVSLKIGLPLQLPYLSPQAHGEAILTGVNFASAASGWFEKTANIFNVVGLATQMIWFQNWKAEVLSVAGPVKGDFIISNALYAISTGVNDWVNNYYISPALQRQYTPDQYTTFLLREARKYIQELYLLGGRNIAILNLPPLGCVPAQITLHGHGNQGCVKYLNDVAAHFNTRITLMLADMKKTMPGSRLILIDIYSPIYNAFQNPQKYGFKYARDGCCGTGELEVSILCNRHTPTCSNPDEHIFWDSFHPTSHFYSQLAEEMYDFASPIILAPPSP
ncbi:hypothetical protein KC19_4G215700 [Ceratodon purpureus]|uniref:Uncharacterized protein n=1 Tax=Ceratodon purpureus TaxID=3225 RepID=A0A8T0IDB6_CERPU|nr:hypothetical protein KC19_4G215700 [Ceratodon purpureus]